ncbi:MAG: HAD family phosphatase, partial [Bacteroidota bacterium]|nr:HAD family phosphatase [Bacteroidota bacterium]
MKKYKNIILDFGGVLLDWNPHHLFDSYFGDPAKADWFIKNVCTQDWNAEMDKGKPFDVAVEERIALFPEWEKEIRLYQSDWIRMIGEEIPGMYQLESDLKAA